MPDFQFDEEKHIYTLGKVEIPSVTEILRPLYDFSGVPVDIMRRAREFGKAAHKTVELYLLDDLEESTLDTPLAGCLAGFKAFEKDHPEFDLSTAAIEKPAYHPKLKYAGTPDIDGEDFLIDLKSREFNPLTDPLQLSAYDNFQQHKQRRGRYVLELKQDGTYKLTVVDPSISDRKFSWSRFRYLLDYHQKEREISKWK